MKLVLISDTHGLHDKVKLPDGDVLVHSGDCMSSGTKSKELISFASWFKAQPHEYKILVAGNHDFFFEQQRRLCEDALGPKVTYLEDSGTVIGFGDNALRFWGSPVQPRFCDWAFNRDRGFAIDQHWRMIPEDTDVLITHGPPDGILDEVEGWGGGHVGCADLMSRVLKVKPKLHVFGHIHHSYGEKYFNGTRFVNASQCNEQYRIVHEPIVVDL